MADLLSRREFLTSAAVGVAATRARDIPFPMRPPQPLPPPSRWAAKPVAVSSANGLRAVQKAFDMLLQGADTLDAVIEGVKIQELDPNDDSVGYGGLPNADGVVQLDASCMHGPSRRAGAVGALEGIKTPSEVAKLVLKYTNHIFLVGEGAKRFALQYGFKEEDLLTPHAREVWLHWRANLNPTDDYLDVPEAQDMSVRPTGTINCDAVTPQGDISSVTTTSGLAFKIPGRVGDSPIIGAGQYTDNDVGAAVSTGRGESNIKVCGGFLTVEFMRRGMKPTDAMPVDPDRLEPGSIVVDIINAPDPTPLCHAARERGCRTQDGRPMHEGQAVHALRFLGFDYLPEGKSVSDIGLPH